MNLKGRQANLPQLILAVLIPATILLFAFPVDLTSELILVFTIPLLSLFMFLIGKLAEKKAEAHWQEMSRVSDDFRGGALEVLRIAFLSALVLELLATLSTALLAVALGLRLVSGNISFASALS